MFIEKARLKKPNFLPYIILPILFLVFVLINYVFSAGVDTNAMIQTYITQFGKTPTFVMLMFPLCVGFVFMIVYIQFLQQLGITRATTSRNKIDWKRIFFSFFLWSSFTIVTTVLAYYSEPKEFILNFSWNKFLPFALIALVLVPMQTSFEEYLFRSQIMQGLGILTKTRWVPFVVSSVLFGLMHIANPEVGEMGYFVLIYYIGTGFFLGIVTLMDEGLELALGFHAANNLVGALLVTTNWSALQTESVFISKALPSASTDVLIPVFIIFPILLILFSKVYKWNNWKEKLFGKLEISLDNDNNSHF